MTLTIESWAFAGVGVVGADLIAVAPVTHGANFLAEIPPLFS